MLLKNVCKTNLTSKSITVQTENKFISKATVNSIIVIASKLMKEEISNSVREAGIYSVQIDSTQDITSTDKCSVILGFVKENVEERFLAVVDSHGNWSRPLQFVKRSFAAAKYKRFLMHLRQYKWIIKHVGAV